MSGYLNRLVERTLGLATPVQPALASRYAPASDADGTPETPESREPFEAPTTTERRLSGREHPGPDRAPTPPPEAERPASPRGATGPEAPAAPLTSPASPAPASAADRFAPAAEAASAPTAPGDLDAPLVPRAPVDPATALSLSATPPPPHGAPAPARAASRRGVQRAGGPAGGGRVDGPGQGVETRPAAGLRAADLPRPDASTAPEDTLLPTAPPAGSLLPARDRADVAGDPRSPVAPADDPAPVTSAPLTRAATQEAAAPLLAEAATRWETRYTATGQGGRRAAPAPPPAPTVRVSIGRIEVRAIQPAPPPAPPPAPRRSGPRLSLEDYLRGRDAREGGAR